MDYEHEEKLIDIILTLLQKVEELESRQYDDDSSRILIAQEFAKMRKKLLSIL